MGNDYTDQHIVPKRYLDRFGVSDGKRTMIGTRIVKKDEVKFFMDSTTNVGYIKNYYDVTDKDDPKYWEHFFAREIDALCGHDMENIIAQITLSSEKAIALSGHDKEMLSKIIVAQLMRIPKSIDYVKKHIYPRVSAQAKEQALLTLPESILEKYRERLMRVELPEQYQKEVILNHTFAPENFERYCKILQDGLWLVYINTQQGHMPFLTSDNPVLVEGIGKAEIGLFANGLANPTTCIFYPLSPEIAVAIYNKRGIRGVLYDEYDGRKLLLSETKFIIDKNTKIMEQAYHHCFIPQPLFDVIVSEKCNKNR